MNGKCVAVSSWICVFGRQWNWSYWIWCHLCTETLARHIENCVISLIRFQCISQKKAPLQIVTESLISSPCWCKRTGHHSCHLALPMILSNEMRNLFFDKKYTKRRLTLLQRNIRRHSEIDIHRIGLRLRIAQTQIYQHFKCRFMHLNWLVKFLCWTPKDEKKRCRIKNSCFRLYLFVSAFAVKLIYETIVVVVAAFFEVSFAFFSFDLMFL